jgi:dTDP-glucose 4,6-dehydratase
MEKQLGWNADENFETGIKKTVNWYMNKYKQ